MDFKPKSPDLDKPAAPNNPHLKVNRPYRAENGDIYNFARLYIDVGDPEVLYDVTPAFHRAVRREVRERFKALQPQLEKMLKIANAADEVIDKWFP